MTTPVKTNPDFPQMEKDLLDKWYSKGIVQRYLKKNKGSTKNFSFQDGPITANNPMGMHHAWGRTYKDIWQRFHNLLGYQQRFQNGFDCQGLWVEVEVEKDLGLRTKKDIENLVPGDKNASIARFVQLCKDRVYKYAKIQTEQSKRLGYFADWDHSYYTMSDENNYMIWHFLKVCHENGWIYKGHESVPWCPRCETAISQHEMLTEDYKEVVHESVFLKLPLRDRQKEYLLVWTTTPWTIIANIAVAVDVGIEYALVLNNEDGNSYWIAKPLVETVFHKQQIKIIKTVLGKELVGLFYDGPFDHLPEVEKVKKINQKKFHTVIPTDPVIMPISTAEGTGLVHTAVSAGTEDFALGKKFGLPMIPVIADDASYLPGFAEFSGKNAKKHPELIINFLKSSENGEYLFSTQRYKHRYPACWRCKTELVWKVADEWYISMDKKSKLKTQKSKVNKTLRQRMIHVAKKIKWMPEFGLERELDWLKNMHDWLISKKNRYWGLALPIYECSDCKSFEVIGSKEELQIKSVSGWSRFEGKSPHKPFIDEVQISCSLCKKTLKRIEDVGNPWLDAGIVPYSTILQDNQDKPLYKVKRSEWEKWFPANFITESFPGQFKNWFYAMIAMSTVLENTHPFQRVLGFATMLGEDGRPMHKSWGNAIEFNEGADKIGVDVIRWLFARQNPADNMLFGYKKTDEVRRQFFLMIWNIFKFYEDYVRLDKGKPYEVGIESLIQETKHVLDLWILNRVIELTVAFKKNLENFSVKEAAVAGEIFVQDLSTWFIRRSRDRVWVNSDNQADKTFFYSSLREVLLTVSVIFSPIMPFLTDYIFTRLTNKESVHLESWPKITEKTPLNKKIIQDMQTVREIVEVGHRVRKELKIKVRQPLAKAVVSFPSPFLDWALKEQYIRLIQQELNVKTVELSRGELSVTYDTILTEELIHEGKLRELIREIQEKRKQLGILPDAVVSVVVPSEFSENITFIKKRVLADTVTLGDQLHVA